MGVNKVTTLNVEVNVDAKKAKKELREIRKIINGIDKISLWVAIKWRIAGIKR